MPLHLFPGHYPLQWSRKDACLPHGLLVAQVLICHRREGQGFTVTAGKQLCKTQETFTAQLVSWKRARRVKGENMGSCLPCGRLWWSGQWWEQTQLSLKSLGMSRISNCLRQQMSLQIYYHPHCSFSLIVPKFTAMAVLSDIFSFGCEYKLKMDTFCHGHLGFSLSKVLPYTL